MRRSQVPDAVPIYSIFDLRFEAESDHPGFAGELNARFESQDGNAREVEGFYDGDGCFRIRFMPDRLGCWRYTVAASFPIKGARSGEFDVVPGERRGPLRVDRAHPHHFVFGNGERFFPLGNTAYNLLSTLKHAPGEADEFLANYAERGFNWVRFFLEQTTWPTHGGVVWPWLGTPDAPDFSGFDLETFRLAEAAIERLAALGSIASVILLHPYDAPLRALRDGLLREKSAVVERYLRYAVARLGAYENVAWNLANEWERGGAFSAEEMDHFGRTLRRIDAYRHPTSCHHYGRFEFPHAPWTDMSSLQHRGRPHEVHRIAKLNRAFGKPVLNEEYGYEGDNHAPPNDPVNVRRDHWALTLAGAYGTYGDKTKGPKVGAYFSATLRDAVGTESPAALGHIRTIMERTEYWRLWPCDELLYDCIAEEVFCLADPGREYLVYCTIGQDLVLQLDHVPASDVRYEWFDPRTGRLAWAGTASVGSTERASGAMSPLSRACRFTPPDYSDDWVLIVRPE